jgi:hypothetical protein
MQPTTPRVLTRPEAHAVNRGGYPPGFLNESPPAPRSGGARRRFDAGQSPDEADGAGGTLDEVARREREAMRPRLRDELGREPTEEELDEWLRRHTEGY